MGRGDEKFVLIDKKEGRLDKDGRRRMEKYESRREYICTGETAGTAGTAEGMMGLCCMQKELE